MSPVPSKSSKIPENQVLAMSDQTAFINKVEDIVDTVLQTLQKHIQKNTSNRTKTMDLGAFFDHVYFWAESLWQDRVEATADESSKNEQPEDLPKKPL